MNTERLSTIDKEKGFTEILPSYSQNRTYRTISRLATVMLRMIHFVESNLNVLGDNATCSEDWKKIANDADCALQNTNWIAGSILVDVPFTELIHGCLWNEESGQDLVDRLRELIISSFPVVSDVNDPRYDIGAMLDNLIAELQMQGNKTVAQYIQRLVDDGYVLLDQQDEADVWKALNLSKFGLDASVIPTLDGRHLLTLREIRTTNNHFSIIQTQEETE